MPAVCIIVDAKCKLHEKLKYAVVFQCVYLGLALLYSVQVLLYMFCYLVDCTSKTDVRIQLRLLNVSLNKSILPYHVGYMSVS